MSWTNAIRWIVKNLDNENPDCAEFYQYVTHRDFSISSGSSILHMATLCRSIDILESILQLNQDIANLQNDKGETALHWAARSANIDILQLLLASGADARIRDNFGYLPIHFAAENGNMLNTECLLNQCPEHLEAITNQGLTPIQVAFYSQEFETLAFLSKRGAITPSKSNIIPEMPFSLADFRVL